MSEFKYALASLADLRILIDSREDFLCEYWGVQEPEQENKLREELKFFFEREIPSQTYVSWIARKEDRFAGIGGMKISVKPGSFRIPDGKNAYIMNMYTFPEFRRRGIGSALLQRLLGTGKELGVSFFELHATKEGEALYHKNGFSVHDQPTFRKLILNSGIGNK
jgi:GNAT superfamily N-acetyltransferase